MPDSLPTINLSSNALSLIYTEGHSDSIDHTLFNCLNCNLFFTHSDQSGYPDQCPNCQSVDLFTQADKLLNLPPKPHPELITACQALLVELAPFSLNHRISNAVEHCNHAIREAKSATTHCSIDFTSQLSDLFTALADFAEQARQGNWQKSDPRYVAIINLLEMLSQFSEEFNIPIYFNDSPTSA